MRNYLNHGILRCKWLLLIVGLLIIVVLLNYCWGIYTVIFNRGESYKKADFSVMTFNIAGLDSTKFTDAICDSLMELIKQEQPSILCFQELSDYNYKKIRCRLDKYYGSTPLSIYDDMYRPYFYSKLHLRSFTRLMYEGNIDTIGLDTEAVKECKQSKGQMPVMCAEFEVVPNKWITLFSGHLSSASYSNARRSMSTDEYWIEGVPLYRRNYIVGRRIRKFQADNIRRYVDKALQRGERVIVTGDLNDFTGSRCLRTIQGYGQNKLKDAWQKGGNGFGFTYFGYGLRLRLDHILYSSNIELVNVKVVDCNISDHKPLKATFRIKQ